MAVPLLTRGATIPTGSVNHAFRKPHVPQTTGPANRDPQTVGNRSVAPRVSKGTLKPNQPTALIRALSISSTVLNTLVLASKLFLACVMETAALLKLTVSRPLELGSVARTTLLAA
jgi:hypothetical protein